MYAASIVATASSDVPNTVDSCRIQAIWYSSAAKPDSRKQRLTPTKTARGKPGRSTDLTMTVLFLV